MIKFFNRLPKDKSCTKKQALLILQNTSKNTSAAGSLSQIQATVSSTHQSKKLIQAQSVQTTFHQSRLFSTQNNKNKKFEQKQQEMEEAKAVQRQIYGSQQIDEEPSLQDKLYNEQKSEILQKYMQPTMTYKPDGPDFSGTTAFQDEFASLDKDPSVNKERIKEAVLKDSIRLGQHYKDQQMYTIVDMMGMDEQNADYKQRVAELKTQEELEIEKEEEADELRQQGFSEEEIEMIQNRAQGEGEGRIGSTEEELLYTQSEEQYDPELRQMMQELRTKGPFKYSDDKVKRAVERAQGGSGKLEVSESDGDQAQFMEIDPRADVKKAKFERRQMIKEAKKQAVSPYDKKKQFSSSESELDLSEKEELFQKMNFDSYGRRIYSEIEREKLRIRQEVGQTIKDNKQREYILPKNPTQVQLNLKKKIDALKTDPNMDERFNKGALTTDDQETLEKRNLVVEQRNQLAAMYEDFFAMENFEDWLQKYDMKDLMLHHNNVKNVQRRTLKALNEEVKLFKDAKRRYNIDKLNEFKERCSSAHRRQQYAKLGLTYEEGDAMSEIDLFQRLLKLEMGISEGDEVLNVLDGKVFGKKGDPQLQGYLLQRLQQTNMKKASVFTEALEHQVADKIKSKSSKDMVSFDDALMNVILEQEVLEPINGRIDQFGTMTEDIHKPNHSGMDNLIQHKMTHEEYQEKVKQRLMQYFPQIYKSDEDVPSTAIEMALNKEETSQEELLKEFEKAMTDDYFNSSSEIDSYEKDVMAKNRREDPFMHRFKVEDISKIKLGLIKPEIIERRKILEDAKYLDENKGITHAEVQDYLDKQKINEAIREHKLEHLSQSDPEFGEANAILKEELNRLNQILKEEMQRMVEEKSKELNLHAYREIDTGSSAEYHEDLEKLAYREMTSDSEKELFEEAKKEYQERKTETHLKALKRLEDKVKTGEISAETLKQHHLMQEGQEITEESINDYLNQAFKRFLDESSPDEISSNELTNNEVDVQASDDRYKPSNTDSFEDILEEDRAYGNEMHSITELKHYKDEFDQRAENDPELAKRKATRIVYNSILKDRGVPLDHGVDMETLTELNMMQINRQKRDQALKDLESKYKKKKLQQLKSGLEVRDHAKFDEIEQIESQALKETTTTTQTNEDVTPKDQAQKTDNVQVDQSQVELEKIKLEEAGMHGKEISEENLKLLAQRKEQVDNIKKLSQLGYTEQDQDQNALEGEVEGLDTKINDKSDTSYEELVNHDNYRVGTNLTVGQIRRLKFQATKERMRKEINTSTGMPYALDPENLRSTDESSSDVDFDDEVRDAIYTSYTNTYPEMKKYFEEAQELDLIGKVYDFDTSNAVDFANMDTSEEERFYDFLEYRNEFKELNNIQKELDETIEKHHYLGAKQTNQNEHYRIDRVTEDIPHDHAYFYAKMRDEGQHHHEDRLYMNQHVAQLTQHAQEQEKLNVEDNSNLAEQIKYDVTHVQRMNLNMDSTQPIKEQVEIGFDKHVEPLYNQKKAEYEEMRSIQRLTFLMRQKQVTQMRLLRKKFNKTMQTKKAILERTNEQAEQNLGQAGFSHQKLTTLFDMRGQAKKQKALEEKQKQLAQGAIQSRSHQFSPSCTDIEEYNKELQVLKIICQGSDAKDVKQVLLPLYEYVLEAMTQNKVKPDSTTKARIAEFGMFSDRVALVDKTLAQLIKEKQNGVNEEQNKISEDLLKQYFSKSIKRRNFDSLTILHSYVSQYNVDISEWDVLKFRSSLEHYLNEKLNLSNVFLIMKYMMTISDQKLAACLEQEGAESFESLDKSQKIKISKEVFSHVQNFVDISELFSFLTEKVGNKTVVDPQTKTDIMQTLLEFFTDPVNMELINLQPDSYNLTLKGEAIIDYIGARIDNQNTFKLCNKVALKLDALEDSQASSQYQKQLIQKLKAHLGHHNRLPKSFSTQSVRNLYITLKQQNAQNGFQVSEDVAEYLLFLMKSNHQVSEVLDFCDNYEKMVKGVTSDVNHISSSEIKNYYLSDALLSVPLKQNQDLEDHYFYDIIRDSVYGKQDSTDPGYITQMTKAFIKDGNPEHAVKFFKEQIETRKSDLDKRQQFLLSLFDSAFAPKEGVAEENSLSFIDFQKKYYNQLVLQEQLIKESVSVKHLQQVVFDKSYEQIEDLLSLYTVMNEERHSLSTFYKDREYTFEELQNIELKDIKGINERQINYIQNLRDRKELISNRFLKEDVEHMKKVVDNMGEGGLKVHSPENHEAIKSITDSFEIKDDQHAKEILDRARVLRKQLEQNIEDQVVAEYRKYHEDKQPETKFEQHLLDMHNRESAELAQDQQVKEKIDKEIQQIRDQVPMEQRLQDADDIYQSYSLFMNKLSNLYVGKHLHFHRDSHLQGDWWEHDISDEERVEHNLQWAEDNVLGEFDEFPISEDVKQHHEGDKRNDFALEAYMERAHNTYLHGMKEELLYAVNSRRQNTFPSVLKIFDHISQKKFNIMKLDQVHDQLNRQEVNTEELVNNQNLGQGLETAEFLLKDKQSPIVSTLHTVAQEKHEQLMLPFEIQMDVQWGYTPPEQILEKINGLELDKSYLEKDLEALRKSQDEINKLTVSLEQADVTMSEYKKRYAEQLEKMAPQKITQSEKYFEHAQEWSKVETEKMSEKVQEDMERRYEEYIKELGLSKTEGRHEMSDEQKMFLIRDAMTLELGQEFASNSSIFPSVFAQDLIVFGLQHKSPDAIRLGEKMISENGDKLPIEMQAAVKKYLLDHAADYHHAIRRTGPIDNSSLYRRMQDQQNLKDGQVSTIANMDDPYWHEFVSKNHKRQSQYKLPSKFAWDHKEYGMIGEMFNLNEVELRVKKLQDGVF